MPGYAQERISEARLKSFAKEYIVEPGTKFPFLDTIGVLEEYKGFFMAVAMHTAKINTSTLQKVVREVYKVDSNQAQSFAQCLVNAFSHVRKAVRKASSGSKLAPVLKDINLQMQRGEGKVDLPFVSFESTTPCKIEPCKVEPSSPPPKPKFTPCASEPRALKGCPSSPTSVMEIYGFTKVKVEKTEVKLEKTKAEAVLICMRALEQLFHHHETCIRYSHAHTHISVSC